MLGGRRAQAWRYHPTYRRPRHVHEESEINLVVAGTGVMSVGTQEVELTSGTLLWLPPGLEDMNPAMKGFIFVIESISHFARLISLSVRLFANILAGHLLLLFMGGGLAVLLGIAALGALTFPLAFFFFVLEVGLIATLQAFIFSTLTAIYIGGAVSASH